ncbi:hypothetical protein T4A_7218 [Trichinella pseudospiralis]|uniref:Uncharacterized protein n=1 Tax=Trichinella pseudospiralis TaxID=6337 RepID=A0A0V1K2C1_TRIPS|nr:hypothetical protein T4A_7218 [Trichinella pseudospiralis]KRY92924.1 hypothetical protein T4D_16873 [Trichinella pseudospiralis]KRZ41383.1 hypothetical protein T4C_7715 [Trichinella pseudospiralis]
MIASLAKRKREAKVVIILETEKHFDTTGSGDIILPSLKIKLPSSQPHQFKAHNKMILEYIFPSLQLFANK